MTNLLECLLKQWEREHAETLPFPEPTHFLLSYDDMRALRAWCNQSARITPVIHEIMNGSYRGLKFYECPGIQPGIMRLLRQPEPSPPAPPPSPGAPTSPPAPPPSPAAESRSHHHTHTMTPKQQRIAIAEAYGYKPVPNINDGCWFSPEGTLCVNAKHLPNYPGSLDAMSAARKRLPASLRSVYISRLADVLIESGNKSITTYDYADATAAQHAEAFLRTIGKWHPTSPPAPSPSPEASRPA